MHGCSTLKVILSASSAMLTDMNVNHAFPLSVQSILKIKIIIRNEHVKITNINQF